MKFAAVEDLRRGDLRGVLEGAFGDVEEAMTGQVWSCKHVGIVAS